MSRDRNVNVRITSSFDGSGLTAAERAAWKLEQRERRMVQMQTQAAREMATSEAAKAQAIVEANRRQSEAMEGFGRTLTLVSAAAAAGMALTVRAAMGWESAWAGVTKTVDGSSDELTGLEADLRALARTLPATHEEIAAVAEAAGQLGVGVKDVAAFTKTMIDLGETTNLSADEAATSLAQLGNIMGVGADQASRMGSALVALGNDGASTEAEIVSMGLRIAGAGRTVGMSTDNVLAFASALSSVGIEAEAGGTAISRVMLQIDKDVATGSDKLEQYAQVAGMTAEEFAAAWGRDATGALSAFIQGLGRMQTEGVNTTGVLDDLGFSEVRVADTLRRAALAGDLLTDSVETGSQAWQENLALVEEANKRYETAESRLATARNQINDAAIDIGGNLLPAVATGAEMVGNLATGFGSLPEPLQRFVTVLGATAVGVGLVGGAALMATPKILAAKAAIDALHSGSSIAGRALGGIATILTGPWGLAIAGAGIALAGLTTLFGAHQKAQEETRREAADLASTFDDATGAMTEYTRQWWINKAATEGWLDDAKTLGINLETFTDALMGNADAAAEVRRQWDEAQRGNVELTGSVRENRGAILGVNEALEQEAVLNDEAASSRANASEAMGEATQAAGDATAAIQDQTAAVDDLIDATNELNGVNQSAEASYLAWKGQIAETTSTLSENAKTLDANTEVGRSNRQTLLDMATTGQKHAESILRQTGSSTKFRDAINSVRQNLFDQARQFFDTEDATWDYVNSLLSVPEEVNTDVEAETAQAEREINHTARDRSATITVRAAPRYSEADIPGTPAWYRARGIVVPQARGGVVEYYAGGGLRESHVAMVAPAGATRVWNEPETGGEAYIPLAPSKRARSLDVLSQVAERFGVGMGGGASFPSHVTLVDESGGILARARVVADHAVADNQRAVRLAGRA